MVTFFVISNKPMENSGNSENTVWSSIFYGKIHKPGTPGFFVAANSWVESVGMLLP